jgi:predicted nucleic acid-binding protein
MNVLLDTCVLSELNKPEPLPALSSAMELLQDKHIFLSVITIGEIQKGIDLLADGKRKTDLKKWFMGLEQNYDDRILHITTETTKLWGELTAKAQKKGLVLAIADGLIASTAIQHGLKLITRNVKDFEMTGVQLFNPWDDAE